MIAMKREVAVSGQLLTGFPWSECQTGIRNFSGKETDDKSLYKRRILQGLISEQSRNVWRQVLHRQL